jgi:hypothetical protein
MKKKPYHRGTEDTEKKNNTNNHGFSRMSTDQIFVFPLCVLRASVVNRLFGDTVIILSRGSATML